ncbi:unnamed protein product [Vitrella brassicaformis CCMP3155]|uniref:Uncharacterized protein n=2 Tax=Vitrella brassicaformis TaxID=1169539 RepID=A0A0G4GXK4_VITBC|nr:unnamed protein product [Vitrella brassicaformis CCMP3155]|eukprot:CEM35577.1 unnamed protein product [Vitrella brassicaformis CCMP3155]
MAANLLSIPVPATEPAAPHPTQNILTPLKARAEKVAADVWLSLHKEIQQICLDILAKFGLRVPDARANKGRRAGDAKLGFLHDISDDASLPQGEAETVCTVPFMTALKAVMKRDLDHGSLKTILMCLMALIERLHEEPDEDDEGEASDLPLSLPVPVATSSPADSHFQKAMELLSLLYLAFSYNEDREISLRPFLSSLHLVYVDDINRAGTQEANTSSAEASPRPRRTNDSNGGSREEARSESTAIDTVTSCRSSRTSEASPNAVPASAGVMTAGAAAGKVGLRRRRFSGSFRRMVELFNASVLSCLARMRYNLRVSEVWLEMKQDQISKKLKQIFGIALPPPAPLIPIGDRPVRYNHRYPPLPHSQSMPQSALLPLTHASPMAAPSPYGQQPTAQQMQMQQRSGAYYSPCEPPLSPPSPGSETSSADAPQLCMLWWQQREGQQGAAAGSQEGGGDKAGQPPKKSVSEGSTNASGTGRSSVAFDEKSFLRLSSLGSLPLSHGSARNAHDAQSELTTCTLFSEFGQSFSSATPTHSHDPSRTSDNGPSCSPLPRASPHATTQRPAQPATSNNRFVASIDKRPAAPSVPVAPVTITPPEGEPEAKVGVHSSSDPAVGHQLGSRLKTIVSLPNLFPLPEEPPSAERSGEGHDDLGRAEGDHLSLVPAAPPSSHDESKQRIEERLKRHFMDLCTDAPVASVGPS